MLASPNIHILIAMLRCVTYITYVCVCIYMYIYFISAFHFLIHYSYTMSKRQKTTVNFLKTICAKF